MTTRTPVTRSPRTTNTVKRTRVNTPTPTIAVVTPPPACGGSLGIFGPAATACAGFYAGNVLSGNPGDLATQAAALASLGVTFSGSLDDYLKIDTSDATFLDFGEQLFGNTVIGIHFGNGSGVGNSTGFFEFDFTSPVSGISLNIPGSSGVVLYRTAVPNSAVPEPATWAMIILGFGATGFAMRRRRKKLQVLSQLA